MLTYSLGRDASAPLYEELYRYIRQDILGGNISPGDRLPSKRSLAKNLSISTITVEHAYNLLLDEGYICSIPRKGYYAADLTQNTGYGMAALPADSPAGDFCPEKPDASEPDGTDGTAACFADFTAGRTNPDRFPLSTWARLLREIIHDRKNELMINSPPGGIAELREAICGYLYQFRGIRVHPDQIIVGAGTEYLYSLLIQLLGRDRIYALETPGYPKIPKIYRKNGAVCRYIPMDRHGVSIGSLASSDADITQRSTVHHFPTGIVTSVRRRYELLSWASESGRRYIIEDDYDSEFRLSGRPIPSMQSIDPIEKVIYINTFTKSLASTVRISYMILPPHLMKKFRSELGFYSCTVSNFEQYTLARFLKEGYFEKHINRMRKYYRNQRDTILRCIRRDPLASGMKITGEDAGLHFLLHVPSPFSDEGLVRRAGRLGILISALSQYDFSPRGSGCRQAEDSGFRPETEKNGNSEKIHPLVISYSGVPPEILPEAVRRLIRALCRPRNRFFRPDSGQERPDG